MPDLMFDGPSDASTTIALAHGSGSGMDTPFMNAFAKGFADFGYRVARFEFPYRAYYRRTGQRMPPDRDPILRDTWLKVVALLKCDHLVLGGKSRGGRIASLIADEVKVDGLVCLGYPFHPVGKPDQIRMKHLQTIRTPTLLVQGERDPFGSREEVARYKLSSAIRIAWLEDGDHSFIPGKKSGRTEQQNWEAAIREVVMFLASLQESQRRIQAP